MLYTLLEIFRDKWAMRQQIVRLSRFELIKRSKNSVLSWAWLIIKPLVTIFCYWFALYVGFRHGRDTEGLPPYILWLISGSIPWFFMSDMLNGGTDLFHKYDYLVTKVRFPLAAIPSIYVNTSFIIQLLLQVLLLIAYFASGQTFCLQLFQLPILLMLLFIFWDISVLLFALLSAINTGVANFIAALNTPIFWLSGVIFNLEDVSVPWLRHLLYLNPVSFFIHAFRQVMYYNNWIWHRPGQVLGFVASFVCVLIVTTATYRWLSQEVPDVI